MSSFALVYTRSGSIGFSLGVMGKKEDGEGSNRWAPRLTEAELEMT